MDRQTPLIHGQTDTYNIKKIMDAQCFNTSSVITLPFSCFMAQKLG